MGKITADEVCKALSEYFEQKLYWDKEDKKFYLVEEVTLKTFVPSYSFDLFELPPHLIIMIGRFYETI